MKIWNKQQWLSSLVITLFFVVIPMLNFNHHTYKSGEGAIGWDVKSYYAYLPAAFIYHDLTLDFTKQNPNEFGKWIWPITTPTGKKAIITSMGLSVMYAPFFFIAHAYASYSPHYEATGYTLPYHVALQFSTYFYFLLSLLILRKILAKYFSDKITALTLFAIGAGTNLLFYVVYAAPMPHGYNFLLISLFIYLLDKWVTKITLKNTIYLGLLSGLIALIRPTNIIILLLIPLWNVGNWKSFNERIALLWKNWNHVLVMAAAFVLVWVPQFIYWKYVSGKFFYFSYGEEGASFFFSNPQFWNVLFSYKKGWFLYTPLMLIATLSIPFLFKKRFNLGFAVSGYWILTVYLIASWWCWWFGGSFGQRSLIDFYGLMAIPLAAFLDWSWNKRGFLRYSSITLVMILIGFNLFNIKQFRNQAIHYWWMNKEAYWENFLKTQPTCKYWKVITIPDYEKARQGIYVEIPPYDKHGKVTNEMLSEKIIAHAQNNTLLLDSLNRVAQNENSNIDSVLTMYAGQLIKEKKAEKYYNEIKIEYLKNNIVNCETWKKELQYKAAKTGQAFDDLLIMEAERIFISNTEKYDKQ